jgi:phenylacetate-coenzyme A ligase PaaK-like adenylate-forming protein
MGVPIGTGTSEKIILTAPLLKANVMHFTSSYAIYIADYLKNKKEMDPRELGIRKIISGVAEEISKICYLHNLLLFSLTSPSNSLNSS